MENAGNKIVKTMSEQTQQTEQVTQPQPQPQAARMGLSLTVGDLIAVALLVAVVSYFASNFSIKSMIKAYPGA